LTRISLFWFETSTSCPCFIWPLDFPCFLTSQNCTQQACNELFVLLWTFLSLLSIIFKEKYAPNIWSYGWFTPYLLIEWSTRSKRCKR
jgi:hypothetical protein